MDEEVIERLDEIERELAELSCRDSGCMFFVPPGQHTNGGCQCLKALNHYLRHGEDADPNPEARTSRANLRRKIMLAFALRKRQAATLGRR